MSKKKLHRNTQHKGIKKIYIYMKSQIQQQQQKAVLGTRKNDHDPNYNLYITKKY